MTNPSLIDDDTDVPKSEKALALIILALRGGDHIVIVEYYTTARDTWRKLKVIYVERSTTNRMRLYERRLTFRLRDEGDVREHVQNLARTRTKFRTAGIVVDDTVYKLALLHSLSTRLDNL